MVVTWASSQPFAHKASSALASVGPRRRGLDDDNSDESQKKLLKYSPWKGTFFFWYKRHLFIYRTMQSRYHFYVKEEVSVSCIGTSPAILKDLFSQCRTEYLKLVKNKTSIFENHSCDWKKTSTVDIRELDTVILSKEKKTALLEDIKSFLDLESRAWYAERGIPYRRGYLLYGPAGTGKSSLSLSIAGECDLDVYILNLAGADDISLSELFAELPPRCVVLIEDVDAAACTHTRRRDVAPRKESGSFGNKKPGGELSLSALLNAIDGVGSQQGRLLIMTTNHIEHLDAALIRPGRIDTKLELGLTTREVNAQLFASIFRKSKSDKGKTESEEAQENAMLMQQAADFARKVPEYKFSPADIQQFLLGYRQSPATAVQNVRGWVEQKCHTTRENPPMSEEFRNDNEIELSDKLKTSPTADDGAQDGLQAKEMASVATPTEMPITTHSHCCSCEILKDIIDICQQEEIPTVNLASPEARCHRLTASRLNRAYYSATSLALRYIGAPMVIEPIRHSSFSICC
jgi:chaperone BCS1